MLPHGVALGQPRGLSPLQYARVGTACHAYIPHYRQHIQRSGTSSRLPRPGRPARRHLQLSERDAAAADQAAAWLLSGQWKQQLAVAVPEAQQRAAAGAQSVSLLLSGAMQQAQAMWQYLLANWPAWKASLQEDAEIVMEYALGLIPAWLAVLHASIVRACQDLVTSAPVQQAVAATAAAVAAAEASATAVTEAAQQSVQQVAQLVKQTLAGSARGSEGPHDSGSSRRGDEDSEQHQLKRGSNLEAARVAYSIAFFGFGSGTSSPAHLFAQHAQQLAQHMSLHDWQEQQLQQQQQQQQQAGAAPYQPRRWRKSQRRDWVDRVVHRALKSNSSSGGGYLAQARDHLFRPRHDGPVWAAPVRAVTGALRAAQHGVQGAVGGAAAGCAEAVRSVQATGRAAVGGVTRAGSMVVTPVQQAVQRLEPPPAGVVALGLVLLAGAVTSTAMRRQRKAAELAVQQRKLMQQRAEELRAQKARIMGVLSVEAPKGSGAARRKGAPAAVQLTNIPVTVVGPASSADSASTDWDAEDDALGSADASAAAGGSSGGGGLLHAVEMDPEAAAMWKKFLAGSRTVDVPMWNNRMVEDLPKVSRREMDKQTQKIRSAAAPEERAAIEQADMEQLSRQLQQLDHAPIGRAARAAWLKEQQQKRQAQAQEQPQAAAAGDRRSRSTSSSPSTDRPGSAGDNSNPFAIPQEVRANWDTDLDDKPRAAAAPRKQTSRAPEPTSSSTSGAASSTRSSSRDGSRPSSRSGSRGGGAGGSDNPFAIPRDARAQWEAEDHLFSEPAKPILGGVLGGLVTQLTSGKARPSTAQQHQERRRHALRAEAAEAAAILRLQQQQEEQARKQQQALPGEAAAAAAAAAPQRSARNGQQQQPTAAAMAPAAAVPQAPAAAGQGAAAGAGAAPAAAGPAGLEGLEEGSPEWTEAMRQEMLRSGAARRARMQQMRSSGARGPQGRQGMAGAGPAASADGSSSSLSVVSAADAAGVTAAIPAPQEKAGAAGSTLGTADAAGSAAADKQTADSGSPSAV